MTTNPKNIFSGTVSHINDRTATILLEDEREVSVDATSLHSIGLDIGSEVNVLVTQEGKAYVTQEMRANPPENEPKGATQFKARMDDIRVEVASEEPIRDPNALLNAIRSV